MILKKGKILLLVTLYSLISTCVCEEDFQNLLEEVKQLRTNQDSLIEKYENLLSKYEHVTSNQEDLESRVEKLEELAKIGTLRTCSEYAQYGLKSSGLYMVDPDGPLIGHPPFEVFCNFDAGIFMESKHNPFTF